MNKKLFEFSDPVIGCYENSLKLKNELLRYANSLSSVYVKLDIIDRAKNEEDLDVCNTFVENMLPLINQLINDSKKILLGGINGRFNL